MVFRLLVSTFF